MVKTDRKRIYLLLVIAGFSLFFLIKGFCIAGEKKRLEGVKIGSPSLQTLALLPFAIGEKRGFYEKEGYDVELYVMRGVLITPALMAGNIDYSGDAAAMRSAAVGFPVKVVFVIHGVLSQRIVARPDIKTMSDLKGKSIGVGSVGGSTTYLAKEIVKYHGLDPDKDVTIVSVGAGMKMHALLSGTVDSAMVDIRESIQARRRGFNELAKGDDIYPLPSLGLGTTDKKIREERSKVKRMIKATLLSMNYLKQNKAETVDYMVKTWGTEKEIASEYFDLEIDTFTKDGTVSDRSIELNLEVGRKLGMIKGAVPISKVVDFSMVKEVSKELGL